MGRLSGRVDRLERQLPAPVGAGLLSLATVRRIIAGEPLIGLAPQEQATAEAFLADLRHCEDLVNDDLQRHQHLGAAANEVVLQEQAARLAGEIGVSAVALLAEAERIAGDPAWADVVRQRT